MPKSGDCRVCVVGAGVVGLSTALHVIQALPDAKVTVVADLFSPHTTSDKCGGFWNPHLLGSTPEESIRRWGRETFEHMKRLAQGPEAGDTGTFLLPGFKLSTKPRPRPFWHDMVLGFRPMSDKELTVYPGYSYGYAYTACLSTCEKYMPWLMRKLSLKGVAMKRKKIKDLAELGTEFDVIVNCTGIGSHDLFRDGALMPVRGQILRIEAPWIKHFVIADGENAYVLPQATSIVVGGTGDKGVWSTQVDSKTSEGILERCSILIPSLKEAKIKEEWAGLRPSRTCVRLERERMRLPALSKTLQVVHNYGHGGAGVTLHWGCAREAAQLVVEALREDGKLTQQPLSKL